MDKPNENGSETQCAQKPCCPWIRVTLLMIVSAALGGGGVYYALQEFMPHGGRDGPSLERLEADISKLNQQIKEIVPLTVQMTEMESQIQMLIHQGETVEQALQRTSVAPQLQEMITQLKGRLEDMVTQTLALRQSQQLGQILVHLQESLDRGSPLGPQLDLLLKVAPDTVEMRSLGRMLAPYRDQAPPTLDALKAEFKTLSGQLIRVTSQGNLWNRTKDYLQTLIVVEPKDFNVLEAPTTAQVVIQIQRTLGQGDMAAAIHAFDKLGEDVRIHGADWYAEAQTYLALHTALDMAISELHS